MVKRINSLEICVLIFKAARDAANRWTDNIFAVKSWCKNKFNIEESTLDKQFGIPAEFEYLE